MKNYRYLLLIILILFGAWIFYLNLNKQSNLPNQLPLNVQPNNLNNQIVNNNINKTVVNTQPVASSSQITAPISGALARVTKKPFGIYVTPKNSPVSPEKFTGYHTGVDFETTPAEQNIDVPIYAICNGPLALKKYATGYGGVAVQSCQINATDVTVVYGHLRLSSITTKSNQQLKAGEQIGVLGTGYSTETAGERKHLHLGIHQGTSIVLLGYVKNKADLGAWLDAQNLLK